MRIESSVTSVSWIPSESISGVFKTGFAIGASRFDDPPTQQLWMGDPFPNPTHGELQLRFTLPVRGQARLELFDVTGRLVRTAFNQVMDAGTYEDNARMEGQKPGVYFYRLTTKQGVQKRTFVLER